MTRNLTFLRYRRPASSLLFFCALVGTFTACDQSAEQLAANAAASPRPAPSDDFTITLEQNLNKWRDKGIVNYRIEATNDNGGFIPPASPVLITVRNGSPFEIRPKSDKDKRTIAYYPKSVEEMFEWARKAKQNDKTRVEIKYDPTRGFPNHLSVSTGEVDGFYTIDIVSFEEL